MGGLEGVDDEVVLFVSLVLGAVCLLLALHWGRLRPRPPPPQVAEVPATVRGEAREGRGVARAPAEVEDGAAARINTCPICLETLSFAVRTNCSHIFCADCIRRCWQAQGELFAGPPCPMCRRRISLLIPTPFDDNIPLELRESIEQFNRRFSGVPRTLSEYMADLPSLARALGQELTSLRLFYIISRARIVFALIVAAIYLLSPFDIVPEAIFGVLGLLDDLFLYIVVGFMVLHWFRALMATNPFD